MPTRPGSMTGARVRPDGRVWFRVSSGASAPVIVDDLGAEVEHAHERLVDDRDFRRAQAIF